MNQNINYIGMVNLLRHLQTAGLVSRKEAGRIAARLGRKPGQMSYFPLIFVGVGYGYFCGCAGIVCC